MTAFLGAIVAAVVGGVFAIVGSLIVGQRELTDRTHPRFTARPIRPAFGGAGRDSARPLAPDLANPKSGGLVRVGSPPLFA